MHIYLHEARRNFQMAQTASPKAWREGYMRSSWAALLMWAARKDM